MTVPSCTLFVHRKSHCSSGSSPGFLSSEVCVVFTGSLVSNWAKFRMRNDFFIYKIFYPIISFVTLFLDTMILDQTFSPLVHYF